MPLLAVALAACAQPSPAGVVVAPVTSAAPASIPVAQAADASAAGDAATDGADPSGSIGGGAGGAPARFRACRSDAECGAVPRVGCCHNGWNEAVAVSQKDAYAASFVCPEAHAICAMFIVRDARQARCDPAAHLCVLVPK